MSDKKPEKSFGEKEPMVQLEILAKELHDQINELRTPFIIEFSGTPKAGKTSSMESIDLWFRRNKIETHTISERAGICPLRKRKKDPTFNLWTGCATVNQLLEALERPEKIVFIDRGIFDILTWMEFHKNNKVLQENEFINIKNFFLNKRFSKLVQIVILLTTDPAEAIERECKNQITDIPGSIMNEDILRKINENIEYCNHKYDKYFEIIKYDTSKKPMVDNLAMIALEVGRKIKEIIDEEIAVVPRALITENIDPSVGILLGEQKVYDLLYKISKNVTWLRRSKAEKSSDFIQLISASTFYYKNKILVFKNRGIKHGRMQKHHAVWAGGHTRRGDHDGEFSVDFMRHTLYRELNEELSFHDKELNLDREKGNIPKYPVAFVWDDFNPKSAQHLGVFYKMYQSKLETDLHEREFTEAPSKSMFTSFSPIDNDLAISRNWESWSKIYLKNVHSLDFPKVNGQLGLI